MALKKKKSTKAKAKPAPKKAAAKKKNAAAAKPVADAVKATSGVKTNATAKAPAKTGTTQKVPAKNQTTVAATKEQPIEAATTNAAVTEKATSNETRLSLSATLSTTEEKAMATPSNQPAAAAANSNAELESNQKIFSQPETPFAFGDERERIASPEREAGFDPLPPPKNIVIADFFLPGCCTFDDDCNPMCSSPEEMLALEIPPIAKSDFITTNSSMSVNVRVLINDDPVTGDKLEIVTSGFTPSSEQGGTVTLSADGTYFTYTPPVDATKAFTGLDKFYYEVRNVVNGLTDIATVYVNVTEGVVGQIVEPSIFVTAEFCAADRGNAQMVPVTIDKGTYTDASYVFTIKNEGSKPWLIKIGDANYAIDTSKIPGNLGYILELQRNGVTVADTNFTVHLITAEFDFTTTIPGNSGGGAGGGNGDFDVMMNSEPGLNLRMAAPSEFFDSNLRISIPPVTLYTLTLHNFSSSQATSFTWQLLNAAGGVVRTQTTINRTPIVFQNIYLSWLTAGYRIRLTATSPIGCTDTVETPLILKPALSRSK